MPRLYDKATIDQVEGEFNQITFKFRPVFGNDSHIRVIKLLSQLRDLEKTLAEKRKSQSGQDKIMDEILSVKKNIIFVMKKV